VSVIVYADGEPEDLRNNLPILLKQDYPDYEIIVVNDGSDGNSEDVLKLFSNEYYNLYYTYVPVDTQFV
ncbi:glycosyltransferase, partial [Parabacteroides merdae]|uniref:glycosyltransferase n=1 Tax=Parabacteroides merdae TaxID=46503 RepID=UPI00210914DA